VTEQSVVFLLGPTASGKTAAALQLANDLDGEIVSVDSSLVYRGMDIGTAKPSVAERAAVPHHLIDICEPTEAYSAARFCDDAKQAIDAIQARGRVPILTGGTMLYFRALEKGLAPLPAADPDVRQALLEEAEQRGWAALHEELTEVDPDSADRIHPNDPQRIQRALEVFELTGEPLTQLQKKVKFALVPESREWLHKRIARRFQSMLLSGFLDEVKSLRTLEGVEADLPSMRSVGYRQAWRFLDGEHDEDTFLERGIAATRQLAKRQLTWIRSMQNLHAIPCDSLNETAQVRAILEVLAT